MPRNEIEPLMTVQEVAEVLRLKPKTIRNKVSRGELKRAAIPGALRFRREDIAKLVAPLSTDEAA